MSNSELGVLLVAIFCGYALFEYALARLIVLAFRRARQEIMRQYWKANGRGKP
ncbi:hypothetical protein [Sphingomonas abietis]|uniref:Heme exporter protein D n=1 Tax=Sphingomonas abietis TaxID=3012344 RepID=A0ABY7NPI3_9SPHN|nr:hypothetical protein [Sphingomonas abietis]WBO23442.1 hypothetical protein PBT88_04745 [Sphingomonas abietis]